MLRLWTGTGVWGQTACLHHERRFLAAGGRGASPFGPAQIVVAEQAAYEPLQPR